MGTNWDFHASRVIVCILRGTYTTLYSMDKHPTRKATQIPGATSCLGKKQNKKKTLGKISLASSAEEASPFPSSHSRSPPIFYLFDHVLAAVPQRGFFWGGFFLNFSCLPFFSLRDGSTNKLRNFVLCSVTTSLKPLDRFLNTYLLEFVLCFHTHILFLFLLLSFKPLGKPGRGHQRGSGRSGRVGAKGRAGGRAGVTRSGNRYRGTISRLLSTGVQVTE